MISKLLRVLLTIVVLGVVALVVINYRNYNSMIPAEYNFVDRLFEGSTEVPQEQEQEQEQEQSEEAVVLEEVIEVDSLEVIPVDSLPSEVTESVKEE